MKKYTVIGLMSGTSLDGLDICAVEFTQTNLRWRFEILNSETVKYSSQLKEKFKKATVMSTQDLLKFDIELGQLFGRLTNQFILSNRLSINFISSHGHTVFHQPKNGFTHQIGNGQEIALETKSPVIFDFRSKDVALGGQGAPLVPIGDALLFSEYDACINFGGIANISFNNKFGNRIAFDICPFNMGLNYLANQQGLEYDDSGNLAKEGRLISELFKKLNELDYYCLPPPKSLGIEWFNDFCLPLLSDTKHSIEDRMHTFTHHIVTQLVNVINQINGKRILITGGGVYNSFLIDLLCKKTVKEIVKPSDNIIEFKEALVFAFLGLLKMENRINVLKSVTGATKDTSSGTIALP